MAVEVLRYREGTVIELGDRVMEPVNGGKRVGTVTWILQPGTDEARAADHPGGGIAIDWDGGDSVFLSPEIITGLGYLFFVRRNRQTLLRYREGTVIELGDRVMEPVDGGRREGTVTGVLQPDTDQARAAGSPDGAISIEWDGDPTSDCWSPEFINEPGCLFFVKRKPPNAGPR